MPKINLDFDTIQLYPEDEKIWLHMHGPDSWTSIRVHGNGLVQVFEKGRKLVELNVLELAEKAERAGFGT